MHEEGHEVFHPMMGYMKNSWLWSLDLHQFGYLHTKSGCNVSKILNEYYVDFIKLDTPHGIKDEMALQYRKTLSDCIKREEWKIVLITEILDCINSIYESNLNEEENLFLLNDLCTL